jgi:hypothetical protein
MPLARAGLYAQGLDIYLAPTWGNSDVWVPTLRHIAKEGRTYVIGVTSCIRATDLRPACPAGGTLWRRRGLAIAPQHRDRRHAPHGCLIPPRQRRRTGAPTH